MSAEQASGAGAIRDAVEGAELAAEGCPVVPLGHRDGVYVYLSPSGEVRMLRPQEHRDAGMDSLFDGDIRWLVQNFPRTDEDGKPTNACNYSNARRWLMQRCTAAGLFDPTQVRGTGVWPADDGDPEGPRLILHCGDRLLRDGQWQPAGLRLGRWIYPIETAVPAPAPRPADRAAAERLRRLIGSWQWEEPERATLAVLGWLACATLVALLPWRPHLWVIGDTGTGKSTLEALLRSVLGENMVLDVSEPTEAAVRQHLGAGARPVLVDEIEPDETNRRARDVAALVRVASRRDQAPVRRGSAGGTGMTFHVRALFYFTSVLRPPLGPQDLNRITALELLPLTGGVDARAALAEGTAWAARAGPALRARVLDGWPRWADTRRIFDAALAAQGHSSRLIDQIGALLTGADLLLHDHPPDSDSAEAWASLFPTGEATGSADLSDAEECLVRLLTFPAERIWSGGAYRPVTLGQMARRAGELNGDPGPLRPHGLSVQAWPEKSQIKWLLVARRHQGLEAVFAGSRWQGGVWAQALRRLPGAHSVDKVVSFAGVKQRAVWLPLDLVAEDGVPMASDEGGDVDLRALDPG